MRERGGSFPVILEFCLGEITKGIRDLALPVIGHGGAASH